MSQLDLYRRNAQRKSEEIAKLQYDKAKEAEKIAKVNNRMVSASRAISHTKSESTIQSKMREIERCKRDIATVENKIAGIEKRIASKQQELITEQGKISREEKKGS